jgi:hypothetical protein
MSVTARASFRISISPGGRPTVKVTRTGEVSVTQFEFGSREEAETWLRIHRSRGTFDRCEDHPLQGPRETD